MGGGKPGAVVRAHRRLFQVEVSGKAAWILWRNCFTGKEDEEGPLGRGHLREAVCPHVGRGRTAGWVRLEYKGPGEWGSTERWSWRGNGREAAEWDRAQRGHAGPGKEAAAVVQVQGRGSPAENGSGNGEWAWMSLWEVGQREPLRTVTVQGGP